MASDQNFVDFVVEQIRNAGEITTKKMFGEYTLYADGKVFALICDNKLYIKPSVAGRAYIGNVLEAPAYQGAKPSFLIAEQVEDSDWLSGLVRVTLPELPISLPKKKKSNKSKK